MQAVNIDGIKVMTSIRVSPHLFSSENVSLHLFSSENVSQERWPLGLGAQSSAGGQAWMRGCSANSSFAVIPVFFDLKLMTKVTTILTPNTVSLSFLLLNCM